MFRIIQHFINIDNNDINDIAIYQRYSHSTQFELMVKMKIIKYTNVRMALESKHLKSQIKTDIEK